VYSALRCSPEEVIREMRLAAAMEWYAQERISQGKGAEIAGLSRAEFIDELARRKIPVGQLRPEEL
jgi:predicted HTH domain antitoxin